MKLQRTFGIFFVIVVFYIALTACSNLLNAEDPSTSFNDQMAAFENPMLPPDQMPIDYNYNNFSSPYPYQTNSDAMYSEADPVVNSNDQRVNSPSRHSALSGSGGGAEEVPFSETRRTKSAAITAPNIGAL